MCLVIECRRHTGTVSVRVAFSTVPKNKESGIFHEKKFTARIGVLALALTLVSTCLLGGTLARYASDITGTGTANIAAWKVAFSQGNGAAETTDFAFTLAGTKTANGNVAKRRRSPWR